MTTIPELMNRDDIAAIIARADEFRVVLQGGEMYLDCPLPDCRPSVQPLAASIPLSDLREQADAHLVSEHLPALRPGTYRCDGCCIPIPTGRGFGRYCGECAQ